MLVKLRLIDIYSKYHYVSFIDLELYENQKLFTKRHDAECLRKK